MALEFDTFRGDVEELDRMARVSWRDEYGRDSYPNLYSPRYFNYLTGALEDRDHLIGAYENGKLIAFMSALPRRFYFRGETYRAALICLLVTRKEAFRRGAALGLAAKALEINKKYNYDFALLYLETGHRSSKMLAKLKAAGNPVQRVKRMMAIVRALDLERIFKSENVKWYEKAAMKLLSLDKLNPIRPDPRIREYSTSDLTSCLTMLEQYKKPVQTRGLNPLSVQVTLTRALEPAELGRELSYPEVAHTLVWEEGGKIRGFINWALVDHVGRLTQPWAWLNHLSFGDLDAKERRELVRAFLIRAKEQGAAGVVEWFKNYYPKGTLWRNRFIPYPRSVDMLAWVFRPGLNLSDIPDVYELQI